MIQKVTLILLVPAMLFSCKGQQKVPASKSNTVQTHASVDTSTTKQQAVQKIEGVVSHRYSSEGCPAVIITNNVAPNGDTLVLIPVHGLEGFDADGLKIAFNYKRSLMRNPSGCHHGVPAMLFNVTKG